MLSVPTVFWAVLWPPHWCSVKASASRAADLGSIPLSFWAYSSSSHANDLDIGSPVATLPGARRFRAETGWPSISML